ncbi:hypothetical protein BY996DRAFT_6604565 [Phakopsora pachyrhizi]|nr:hypothetical protein BY996DRAFT_6604565 [Phakopsora pachyrhizi]
MSTTVVTKHVIYHTNDPQGKTMIMMREVMMDEMGWKINPRWFFKPGTCF